MKFLSIIFTFLIIIVSPYKANAELISLDDGVFGQNSITLDTETGLEWLDLSKSQGYGLHPYESFHLDGQFEGFHWALENEVLTLWDHANIPLHHNASFDSYGDQALESFHNDRINTRYIFRTDQEYT